MSDIFDLNFKERLGNFCSRLDKAEGRLDIILQRLVDMDIRLIELESPVMKRSIIFKKSCIPNGWLNVTQFADRYKFISTSGLSHIIADYPIFFHKKTKRVGCRLYIDPLEVAIFCERGLLSSVRLQKQYINWRGAGGDLSKLSEQACKRIKILDASGGNQFDR